MIPSGPDTKPAFTSGFFDVAAAQNPKPQTVAMIAADQEFSIACDGAKDNAKKHGLRTVYDRTYPPNTADFAPIMPAIQAANPDVIAVCSYPLDSVGIVRAVNELNYKPKMIGGAMVELPATRSTPLGRCSMAGCELRDLGPGQVDDVRRHRGLPFRVPGPRRRGRGGPARLLSGHLGLRLYPESSARRWPPPRASTTMRLPTTSARRRQDHHGRRQVRQGRRVGRRPNAASPVSRHQEHRARSVPGHWTRQRCSRPRNTRPAT